MYVYRKTERSLWTVGFYSPGGTWEPESDHNTPEEAASRVAYLNGVADAELHQAVKMLTVIDVTSDGGIVIGPQGWGKLQKLLHERDKGRIAWQ